MKFRLSTILLVIALTAALLAWHSERESRSNITGTWKYPCDTTLNGTAVEFSDTLTITPDGRFTKQQQYGGGFKQTYEGSWHTDQSGMTTFHVTKVSRCSLLGVEKTVDADYRFLCRCTLDSFGFLVTNEHLALREHQEFDEETTSVRWRSYCRKVSDR